MEKSSAAESSSPSTIVSSPYPINGTFSRLTNHSKKIQSIQLGRNCTWIITQDIEEKKDDIYRLRARSHSLREIPNRISLSNMLLLIISVVSYEVPFDEVKDDIDRAKLTLDGIKTITDKDPKCGICTNAVYTAFRDNAKNGFNGSYASIIDDIIDKNSEPVPVLSNFENKIGQQTTRDCPFLVRDQVRLIFERNKEVKISKKDIVASKSKIKEANVADSSDCEGLMKLWGLELYADLLIVEYGFDDTEDWKGIELKDLQEMGFKMAHARKFMRKVKELFDI